MILFIKNVFFRRPNNTTTSNKSYVTRKRYISKKKIFIFLKYWATYGIFFSYNLINFSSLFSLKKKIIVEIGFGDGKAFIEKVALHPHINFIGIEVYQAGVFSAIKYANSYRLSNVKIIFHDAYEVFMYMIPNRVITALQIFFPDPWPKKKHNKRRLINSHFIKLVEEKIILGGWLHVITDCQSYSENIHYIMSQNKHFKRFFCEKNIFPLFVQNKITKFEKKSILLDHTIFDYKYRLVLK